MKTSYTRLYAETHQECEALRAEVKELRALLAPVPLEPPLPAAWGLTPLEIKLLGALKSTPGILTRERALAALYGGRDNVPEPAIINVVISRLRAKLAAQGLRDVIWTQWGRGWHVPAEAWARLGDWSAER